MKTPGDCPAFLFSASSSTPGPGQATLFSRLPRTVFRSRTVLGGHFSLMDLFPKQSLYGLKFNLFLGADQGHGYA